MMLAFECVGDYEVVGGAVPKFRGDPGRESYLSKDYPRLGRLKVVVMFVLVGHEHLGMVPEFLVRKYWPDDAVDMSGRFQFRPLTFPARARRPSPAAMWRLGQRSKPLRDLLNDLPDEL